MSRRQRGRVVRASELTSRDRRFKTLSYYYLVLFNSSMLLANCVLPPTRWDFQLLCSFRIFDLLLISAVPETPLGEWLIKIFIYFTLALSLGFQMLGNPHFLVPSAMRPPKLRITLVSHILLGDYFLSDPPN